MYTLRQQRFNFKNKYDEYLTSWIYAKFPETIGSTIDIAFDNNYIRLGNTAYEKRGLDVIKQRSLTLKIFNIATYDLQYDLLLNIIVAYYRDDSPYYLIDLVTEKRYRVNLDDIKIKESPGNEKRFSEIELGLSIIDSLPEKLNPTIQEGTLNSGENFDVILPIYAAETPFILTLSNTTGSNIDFYLESSNRDKSGNLQITEIGFLSGTQIVIDTLEGTCTLQPENINIKRSIADGTFFLLHKGTNTINYQSLSATPIDYSLSYRLRTAI